MKKYFNWAIVIAACIGAFYCIGLIVPRSQTSGSKTTMTAKPEELYATVSDLTVWTQWHPDIQSVVERPMSAKDNLMWRVTEKSGAAYDLEVISSEEAASWEAKYSIDGAHYTLRYEFGWYGEGGRIRLKRTVDIRDPWKRAKAFLWFRSETAPAGLLNALARHLGEPGTAKDD